MYVMDVSKKGDFIVEVILVFGCMFFILLLSLFTITIVFEVFHFCNIDSSVILVQFLKCIVGAPGGYALSRSS